MLIKRCIFILGVLLGSGTIFLWAKELIRLDIRSVEVQTESLPLSFPGYPAPFIPEVKEPSVQDVQLNITTVPHYEFLSDFAKGELEEYHRDQGKKQSQ